MESYVSIGYTRKPVGIKGELRLHVEEPYLEDFLRAQVLFLEMGGAPVPYFVENIRIAKTPIVKFEEVDSPDAAQQLGGVGIALRKSDLKKKEYLEIEESDLEFEFLTGYTLYDKTTKVGEIKEVQEFPQQEMAIINYQGNDIYIPLNDQLIVSIDEDAKSLIVDVPEGLLDL